jgi:DNA primase
MELYVTELPEGLDPYDCLVEKGAKVFEDCIARAKDIFTCRWETFQHKYDFNKIEEKGRAIDEILETVALIPNTTRRHLTLQRLSEESKVKETVLLKRLEEIKLRGRRTVAPIAAALIKPPQNELNAAKNIIEITLNYNEGIPLVRGRLGEAELDTPSLTLIFREICRIYDEYNKVTLEMLLAVLAEQSDLVQEIVEITQRGTTGKGCNYQKFLADNLVFFDQQHKRLMVKTDLRQRIKEAHARSDKTEEERLLVELMELEKSLHPELACKK